MCLGRCATTHTGVSGGDGGDHSVLREHGGDSRHNQHPGAGKAPEPILRIASGLPALPSLGSPLPGCPSPGR